ncbi:MAG: AgmX/PglI C-terminal domain-containing protein [Gemmatimonadaceae bacterium]
MPPAAAASVPAGPEPSRDHLGSRDPVTVGSYARARDAELQFCYLEGVKSHPQLAGRLTVHITVDGSGRVTAADIISRSWDRSRAKHVEACVLSRIQRWQFEESGEKEQVYPLILLFSR